MQRKNHHVVLHRSELLAQVKTGAIHAQTLKIPVYCRLLFYFFIKKKFKLISVLGT